MTTSVSEKFSKKLGRPRVIPADHERVIDFVLSHKSNPSASNPDECLVSPAGYLNHS